MSWHLQPCALPCESARQQARQRQASLTKPPGSLGRLEDIATDFAAWQRHSLPQLDRIAIRVFAGDHGICARGVSAFPAEVTTQMITNFVAGGAAISVLARQLEADFAVVNMGTLLQTANAPGLVNVAIAPGTRDFSTEAAMTAHEVEDCLASGAKQIEDLDAQLYIAGDMGIGNTTAAAAMLAALCQLDGAAAAGRGTGVDDAGLARKRDLIDAALLLHTPSPDDPLAILRCLGGLEIAAMCGSYIRAAQRGIPILVDGFIASVATLIAVRINPTVQPWLIAGHRSAEQAHQAVLDALALRPLLDLDMRLGEGSGAAVAVPLLQAALQLHSGMASFADAGVSEGG